MPGQCSSNDDEGVNVTLMGVTSKKVEDGGGGGALGFAIVAEISTKADHVVMAAKAKEPRDMLPNVSIGMVRVEAPFSFSSLAGPFL